jgi:hypothetical protein
MKRRSFSSQKDGNSSTNSNAKNEPNSNSSNNPATPVKRGVLGSNPNRSSILNRINSNNSSMSKTKNLDSNKTNSLIKPSNSLISNETDSIISSKNEDIPVSNFDNFNTQKKSPYIKNNPGSMNSNSLMNSNLNNSLTSEPNSQVLNANTQLVSNKKPEYSLRRAASNLRPAIRKKNTLIETDKANGTNKNNVSEIKSKNYEEKRQISCTQKIWIKLKKNLLLMATIIFMIYVYYVYTFVSQSLNY